MESPSVKKRIASCMSELIIEMILHYLIYLQHDLNIALRTAYSRYEFIRHLIESDLPSFKYLIGKVFALGDGHDRVR